jgi:hypothetical protein
MPAAVVGGVRLVQCPKRAALLLVGKVSVGVGGGGSDDRHVDVDRREEEVFVAVDLHELDEVLGDGVHLGTLQPRVRVSAKPDFGHYARLPCGGGSMHLEQHAGRDVERLNLIIVNQFPNQRGIKL